MSALHFSHTPNRQKLIFRLCKQEKHPHYISGKHILESHTQTMNLGDPPFGKNISGEFIGCARSNALDQVREVKCATFERQI